MSLIQQIDALLPQTQCGKCGHPGCKPYAQGIAQGEAINKCPPGGEETLHALAQLLQVPVIALDAERGSAAAQVAYIREAECIGCTKCIQACPVDAILGAAKLMHSVIVDECTGCDLCVAPCPVDCIEMRPLPQNVIAVIGGLAQRTDEYQARAQKRQHARFRYEQREARLKREDEIRLAARAARSQPVAVGHPTTRESDVQSISGTPGSDEAALKKAKITLAMARAQLHKSLKAFGHPPTAQQQAQLNALGQQFESAEQVLATLEKTPQPLAPTASTQGADLKRAKIQLALRRAELNKAISLNRSTEELAPLKDAADRAERLIISLNDASA